MAHASVHWACNNSWTYTRNWLDPWPEHTIFSARSNVLLQLWRNLMKMLRISTPTFINISIFIWVRTREQQMWIERGWYRTDKVRCITDWATIAYSYTHTHVWILNTCSVCTYHGTPDMCIFDIWLDYMIDKMAMKIYLAFVIIIIVHLLRLTLSLKNSAHESRFEKLHLKIWQLL